MATHLLTTRRFAPLFWCQFFSAFNDNFLKNALVILILFKLGGSHADALVPLTGAIFIAPFFFLSGLGGQLADRFDKARVARRLKLAEIAAAAVAVVGFGLESVLVLFAALFLFGVIAALFGPIKYGILPDHLAREELPAGNALVEAATFLAILLGTIAGGIAAKGGGHPAAFGMLIMAFAALCWGASLLIPRTGEAAPALVVDANIVRSTASLLRHLWSDSRLRWGGLVTSWFWLAGAAVLLLLPTTVKTVLGGTEDAVNAFIAMFSVAVAVGSGLAAWLAHGRIVLLPVAIGAVIIGVAAIDLGLATLATPVAAPMGPATDAWAALASPKGIRIASDLVGLAIGGGLFIVPSFTAVQVWAGPDRRARVIAAVNVLNAAFIAVSALVIALLQAVGVGAPALFLVIGGSTLAAALAIVYTLPTSPLRDLRSIVFRTDDRLEVEGPRTPSRPDQTRPSRSTP